MRHRPERGLRPAGMLQIRIFLLLLPQLRAFVPPQEGQLVLSMRMLMWNPHYECFEWNQMNCSGQAFNFLKSMLVLGDIDFAGLVQFDFEMYKFEVPERWKRIRHKCHYDTLDLVYDATKWRKGGRTTRSQGCMVEGGRPYIIEQFKPFGDEAAPVIVMAAHFPHPDFHTKDTHDFGRFEKTLSVLKLATSLQRVLKEATTTQVMLIAQTNSWDWISSERIMRLLSVPKGDIKSTSAVESCCLDTNFSKEFAFDRIMTNFGYTMLTSIQFRDAVPEWALQSHNGSVGPFHKPVKGTLVLPVRDVDAMRKRTTFEFAISATAGIILWASCCVCYRISLWKLKQTSPHGTAGMRSTSPSSRKAAFRTGSSTAGDSSDETA